MTRRQRPVAESDVTLDTNKLCVGFLLVHLIVENAAVISRGGYVTTFGAAARSHRDLRGFRYVVAVNAGDFGVRFVPESAGGRSSLPQHHQHRIVKPDCVCQLSIEISRMITRRLVATTATLRQRRELAFLVVTGEAVAMRQRDGFEASLLQPERVAVVLRWFRYELIISVTLRFVGLMTRGAALRILSSIFDMFVVRERDPELRNKISSSRRSKKLFAQTRKRKA